MTVKKNKLFRLLFPWVYTTTTSTVRTAFPFFVSALTIVGFTATIILSGDKAEILLESSSNYVQVGEQFTIDVYVVAKSPINAVDIEIELSPEQVSILGIDTGKSVITLWTTQPSFENGNITLTGGTFRRGFIGKHLVASIRAEAKVVGSAHIHVSEAALYAGDGIGSAVQIEKLSDSAKLVMIGDYDDSVSQAEGRFGLLIVGDLDGDGVVSLRDVSIFMAAWKNKDTIYDLTGDGKMTFRDFSVLLSRLFFGKPVDNQ